MFFRVLRNTQKTVIRVQTDTIECLLPHWGAREHACCNGEEEFCHCLEQRA